MRPRQVGSPIVDFQPFRRQKTRARETRRRRALRREPRSSDWPYDTAYLAGVKCTVTVTLHRNPRPIFAVEPVSDAALIGRHEPGDPFCRRWRRSEFRLDGEGDSVDEAVVSLASRKTISIF
jgi:ribosomal protein L24E